MIPSLLNNILDNVRDHCAVIRIYHCCFTLRNRTTPQSDLLTDVDIMCSINLVLDLITFNC